MNFDLAGHAHVSVRSDAEDVRRSIERQLSPYLPDGTSGDSAAARVNLVTRDLASASIAELQLAAGDGFVTGTEGSRLYWVSGGMRASVPEALGEEPAEIAFDAGFPISSLFRHVVRPALQLSVLRAGSVALHAGAVVQGGRAVLVGGWSETGKTETVIAMAERGAQFLTDKWTLVGPADGGGAGASAAPFPVNVGIRRWLLPYAPRLRAAVPGRSRLRFAAASAWGFATRPLRSSRRRGSLGVVSTTAERALALADRASLSPAEVAGIYGHEPIRGRIPIGLLVLLRTVPQDEVSVREVDAAYAAERQAASAITERQGYFALRQRAAYAVGVRSRAADIAALEAERMRDLLGAVTIVEVSAPFPTDPRRVVAALEPWLPTTS